MFGIGKTAYEWIWPALIALCVVGGHFALEGHVGLNLWDEGFLWYGVQRVISGEVPIRDFMAYDPGRYYWCAALMSLWDNQGIVALRAAVALFQYLGLLIGLVLVVRNSRERDLFLLLVAAITFEAWMFPRFKLHDISASIALVGILYYLVREPSAHRFFAAGVVVGITAMIGQNHGFYGVISSLAVMAFLFTGREMEVRPPRAAILWALGIVVGYLPVLLMIAAVPGYARALWGELMFMIEFGATNLPLPVPWPWRVHFDDASLYDAVRQVMIGTLFIAIPVFSVLSILWVVWQRLNAKPTRPALVASAFVSVPYAHYAFSRADTAHLALGIFPVLIGTFVLLGRLSCRSRWPLAALICSVSPFVMVPRHPGWACRPGQSCVVVEVAGSELTLLPSTAAHLKLLDTLADRYAPDGGSFIAAPFWPGAYAALEGKSPMWGIYALFPRSEEFQLAEISRIKAAAPGFALIYDYPLDGRDDLGFKNTHPLIVRYLGDHFERVHGYTLHPSLQLYVARPVTQ